MGEPEGPPPTNDSSAFAFAVIAVVKPFARSERRRRLHVRFSRRVHVGSEAKYGHVEEVQTTVNISRDGLYFTTSLQHYHVGCC